MKKRLLTCICMMVAAGLLTMADMPSLLEKGAIGDADAWGWHPKKGNDNDKPKPNPTSVPEPSTLLLLGAGVAGIGSYVIVRRNKKK